jgi:hypothetical protein
MRWPSRAARRSRLRSYGATNRVAQGPVLAVSCRRPRRWPSRRRNTIPPPSSTSRALTSWPVFRCPSLAGFGCPPRASPGRRDRNSGRLARYKVLDANLQRGTSREPRGRIVPPPPWSRLQDRLTRTRDGQAAVVFAAYATIAVEVTTPSISSASDIATRRLGNSRDSRNVGVMGWTCSPSFSRASSRADSYRRSGAAMSSRTPPALQEDSGDPTKMRHHAHKPFTGDRAACPARATTGVDLVA